MTALTHTRTTFIAPPGAGTAPPVLPPRRTPRRDDLQVLVDRVAGDGHAPWRATAAARLAAALLAEPDGLAAGDVARLDAALPHLLRDARDDDTPALVALVAALGARLSPAVCPPLQDIVRCTAAPVAVAAHVASLLVEGLVPSVQHLADLTAVADADPMVLAASRGRPAAVRAAALAYALAGRDG